MWEKKQHLGRLAVSSSLEERNEYSHMLSQRSEPIHLTVSTDPGLLYRSTLLKTWPGYEVSYFLSFWENLNGQRCSRWQAATCHQD